MCSGENIEQTGVLFWLEMYRDKAKAISCAGSPKSLSSLSFSNKVFKKNKSPPWNGGVVSSLGYVILNVGRIMAPLPIFAPKKRNKKLRHWNIN
ncbi:hypothetical protein THMIRHAT_22360 [Thiosulfativibrio zosterae]|uniref:Uncharacterized protein n=1 Tax=Thiosulfativibrio zosterae TaxID=2675053 RepID=A0A6F8PR76_9GAMM|nr:hypothetical protein THMIRHAT_22360 [Thiosulfativibrio zosterae]